MLPVRKDTFAMGVQSKAFHMLTDVQLFLLVRLNSDGANTLHLQLIYRYCMFIIQSPKWVFK